jgi:two-component system sensor histidine kinase/response regulator
VNDAEKRILIVDDDDAIRVLLRTILQRRGLTADSARDGREALACLARARYAVMLLDLMMPRGSGWDVLGEIARWPLERRPITIVLTAGTEPRTLDPSLVAGTVRKPFDIDMLVDTVSACVRSAPARKQSDDQPSPTQTIN